MIRSGFIQRFYVLSFPPCGEKILLLMLWFYSRDGNWRIEMVGKLIKLFSKQILETRLSGGLKVFEFPSLNENSVIQLWAIKLLVLLLLSLCKSYSCTTIHGSWALFSLNCPVCDSAVIETWPRVQTPSPWGDDLRPFPLKSFQPSSKVPGDTRKSRHRELLTCVWWSGVRSMVLQFEFRPHTS